MPDIHDTLAERGKQYGEFHEQSEIAQCLKMEMRRTEGWDRLTYDKRECLDMFANKIARILNGNPEFHDSWHDLSGYATLVADRILAKQGAKLDPRCID